MLKKFFLGLIILLAAAVLWYRFELASVGGDAAKRVKVEIPRGASVSAIAAVLAQEEAIRSPLAFKLYVRLHDSEKDLQAGTFIFSPAMSVGEIVHVLRSGKSEEMAITIPEGWTLTDIDALIAQEGLAATGSLLECARTCDFSSFTFLPAARGLAPRGGRLEGYLFPDTYYVSTTEFVPKFFLERLLTTFHRSVVDRYSEEIGKSGHSLHDIVTMASLVEAETRTDEERPIVAGILWKRLAGGIGLGVDATVRYILEKPSAAITATDLDVQSPYNTRKFRGLPPGPIASPGIASILAALRPEESRYWYYLHDARGQIHYAETNDEHNNNRKKFLK